MMSRWIRLAGVGLLLGAAALPVQAQDQAASDAAWKRLLRAGVLFYSDGSLDPAREGRQAPAALAAGDIPAAAADDGNQHQSIEKRRKVVLLDAIPGDADFFKSLVIRRYTNQWQTLATVPVPAFSTLSASSAGGDTEVATRGFVLNYIGSYLKYFNLDSSQTDATYAAQREAFFKFIRDHFRHRWATAAMGPMLAAGGAACDLADLYDAAKAHVKDVTFVGANSARVQKNGTKYKFAKDGFTKEYEFPNWKIEFLFQTRKSYPVCDQATLTTLNLTPEARRFKSGSASDSGWWLSPALYKDNNPPGLADERATFGFGAAGDTNWNDLKNSGKFQSVMAANGAAIDPFDANTFSVLWNPPETVYDFDPGHKRDMTATDATLKNQIYNEYQLMVYVRTEGDVIENGVTTHVGPHFFSDSFYGEMYLTDQDVPKTLADARTAYGGAYATTLTDFAPGEPGGRTVTPPDEMNLLFDDATNSTVGTKDALTYWPKTAMNLAPQLGSSVGENVTMYYKCVASTGNCIRIPEKNVTPPTPGPEITTAEGYNTYINTYYKKFVIFYPPVVVGGVTYGPFVVDALDSQNAAFVYKPTDEASGTGRTWGDLVYQPRRIPDAPLATAIHAMLDRNKSDVANSWGLAGSMPAGFAFANKGTIQSTADGMPSAVFEFNIKNTGYTLPAGACPNPVSGNTAHGKIGTAQVNSVAGADVNLSGGSSIPIDPNNASSDPGPALKNMRDNFAYCAVVQTASCCGSQTVKVIEKAIACAGQPQSGIYVSLIDPQELGKTNSIVTMGVPQWDGWTQGVPYTPQSLTSRVADPTQYRNYKYNVASVTQATGGPELSDATGKSLLEATRQYFAGQEYTIRFAAEPVTAPTISTKGPDGNPSPTGAQIYYCAGQFKVKVNRLDGATKSQIKEFDLLPPPLNTGPFAKMSIEPPTGTVQFTFPQEGDYEIESVFTDCNDNTRSVTARVSVVPKGFSTEQKGEERQRK